MRPPPGARSAGWSWLGDARPATVQKSHATVVVKGGELVVNVG